MADVILSASWLPVLLKPKGRTD